MKTKITILVVIFILASSILFANDKKISKLENQIDKSFTSYFKKSDVNWELIESSYYEYMGQHNQKLIKGKLKFEYFSYKDFWLHNRGTNVHYYVCDSIKKNELIKNIEKIGIKQNNITLTIGLLKSFYEPYMNQKWQKKYEKETIIRIGNILIKMVNEDMKFASYNDFMGYLVHKFVPDIDLDKDAIQKTLIIAGFPDVVYNMVKFSK